MAEQPWAPQRPLTGILQLHLHGRVDVRLGVGHVVLRQAGQQCQAHKLVVWRIEEEKKPDSRPAICL